MIEKKEMELENMEGGSVFHSIKEAVLSDKIQELKVQRSRMKEHLYQKRPAMPIKPVLGEKPSLSLAQRYGEAEVRSKFFETAQEKLSDK